MATDDHRSIHRGTTHRSNRGTIADRARELHGRTVTVTLATEDGSRVDSEPSPITGRMGYVHEDVYLHLLDTTDGRRAVRVMIKRVATLEPTPG